MELHTRHRTIQQLPQLILARHYEEDDAKNDTASSSPYPENPIPLD